MKTIAFKHRYPKLNEPQFTTIRGKSSIQKYTVGEVVLLRTLDGDKRARVTRLELRKLNSIPIETLSKDGSHPGAKIDSLAAFVELMNSVRTNYMPEVREDTRVTVIYLQAL